MTGLPVWNVLYKGMHNEVFIAHASVTPEEAAKYVLTHMIGLYANDNDKIYVFPQKEQFIFHVRRSAPKLEADMYYKVITGDEEPLDP